METIIGLLVILLPAIFKLIEKKLQNSGKLEQAGKVRDLSSAFEPDPEPLEEPIIEIPKPVKVEVKQPQKIFTEGQRMTRKKAAPILLEEPDTKKKEKIDPKKLVLYSEIMKPKYEE